VRSVAARWLRLRGSREGEGREEEGGDVLELHFDGGFVEVVNESGGGSKTKVC